MSDLESRLRDVLTERAAAAPDAIGLAHGARRRLRRRRTTRAVAAAAVVAAAVPFGLGQLTLGADGTGRVADDPTATSGLPPGVIETGYRAESWHDVTFEVPVDWGYGGVTAWCVGEETPGAARPVVTRPDTAVERIACTPVSGYGVIIGSAAALDPVYESGYVWQFDSAGVTDAQYPDGSWLGYWYDSRTVVTVVAPDRATARRLVDSVDWIDGVDPNECPVENEGIESLRNSTSDSFSICRYDEEGLLTASRRFIGEQSAEVQNAVSSSPVRRKDYDCPSDGPLPSTVLLQGGGFIGTVVTDATCEGNNGFFMSGAVRDLTPEALRHLDLSQLPVEE